ncbi:MAG: FecR domain-containing protein [Terriglobales bacterium]
MSRLRVLVPFLLALGLALVAQPPTPTSGKAQLSHVRIVRVSLSQGGVEINQQAGRGWQRVSVNAPISQSDAVRTGADGRAAIELEAGSTIKLTPNSEVTFQRLALTPQGERLSDVAVTSGTVFFTLEKKDAQGFRALFPEGVATSDGHDAEFRVDVSQGRGTLRVLNGRAEVAAGNDSYLLKRNDVLELAETAPAELAKSKTRDAWDQWSESLDQTTKASDVKAGLASYGAWRGNWWYPTVAANWNPYLNGAWFFDPTYGYVWDSFYAWGWDPFHYGMWWDSPLGWAWSPMGGAFFMAAPQVFVNGAVAQSLAPPRPPAPLIHRGPAVSAIRVVKSAGVAASAGTLGTPAWYRARAQGRFSRAGISGSEARRAGMSRMQMAAQRRARSTFGRDRQRVMGPRIMQMGLPRREWPGASANGALPISGASSSMAAPRAPMPVSPAMSPSMPAPHVSGGARVIPK